MAKFGKWLGGGLGWVLGGPIGGIIGFGIGALFDNAEIRVETGNTSQQNQRYYNKTTRQGDFAISLLVLSAAVMKSDGKTLKSELDYVFRFFKNQFGEPAAKEQLLLLREILKKEIPLHDVCLQIKHNMPLSARLQLLHYLYGIGAADGEVHPNEIRTIENIAHLLGINENDILSIKAMYFRDTESDYKILEIRTDASDEEVKKAYRKMAMKFHPDKVSGMGESVEKAANEKFRKVQEAYENIKKNRGI
jgi:DnaJ like chaperone protein